MKTLFDPFYYRGLFIALLFFVGLPNKSIAQIDLEFINVQVDNPVVLGSTFQVSGTLRNNGTTPIPANVGMYIETVNFLISQPPYDGDYIEDYFYNPILQPNETFNFSRNIYVDPVHFPPEQDIIVIIWPRLPNNMNDIDTTNNILEEIVYVKDNGYTELKATICKDQTLPLGFEFSTNTFIEARVRSGVGPFTFQWNTGETTPVINVQPTSTSIYKVTVTDAFSQQVLLKHVVNVVDISCGNNLITMCHNTSSPHSHCVDVDSISMKLGN